MHSSYVRTRSRRLQTVSPGLQLLGLLVLVVVMFVTTLGVSLLQTVRHTNDVEASRSRLAVSAALHREVATLADYAYDNGYWDDAALALYQPKPDVKFLNRTWGSASSKEAYVDRMIVFDPRSHVVVAYHSGSRDLKAIADLQAKLTQTAERLRHRLTAKDLVATGIIQTTDGPYMVAVTLIKPIDPQLLDKIPPQGAYTLLIAKRLDQKNIARMGHLLMLEDMSLSLAPPTSVPSYSQVGVKDLDGQTVAYIGWVPAHSGMNALRESLPLVLSMALLHVLLAGLAIYRGYRWLQTLGAQALMDSLCGLPNRRALIARLQNPARLGQTCALALLDLDGFKAINDTHGHHIGDQLICVCATDMARIVGPDAMVARLGGDEFAVLVFGETSQTQIMRIAQAILAHFSTPVRVSDTLSVSVGTSIGLVTARSGALDASEILHRADVAMYASKRSGKMRATWFSEQHSFAHSGELHVFPGRDRAATSATNPRRPAQFVP